jgi:hypothetical protein
MAGATGLPKGAWVGCIAILGDEAAVEVAVLVFAEARDPTSETSLSASLSAMCRSRGEGRGEVKSDEVIGSWQRGEEVVSAYFDNVNSRQ